MPKNIVVTPPDACTLCPRRCKADRAAGQCGFCGAGNTLKSRPGGAPFLGGALHQRHQRQRHSLFLRLHPKCCFCQNYPISAEGLGKEITVEHLAEIFLNLQEQCAHNINLVTPGQWRPWIIAALDLARAQGLHLPIVCNTGGYETVESVEAWRGSIDIWLADLKYVSSSLSAELSSAPDYFAQARPAIEAMMAQAGHPVFDAEGILQKGRHPAPSGSARPHGRQLCRPGPDGCLERGRPRVFPAQRHEPVHAVLQGSGARHRRRITTYEYRRVVNYAMDKRPRNGLYAAEEQCKRGVYPQL